MKTFIKHVFIVFFGMLVYFIIISINDVYSPGFDRWERGWLINGTEILMGIFISYVCMFIAEWWERKRRMTTKSFSSGSIFKEFLSVFLSVFVFINLICGPVLEILDKYELHDFVVVNTISLLFTLNYYFILRGNFYVKQYIDNKLLLEKLENDKIREELKYLKNQIHPHFLFNALNTIYFQMDENIGQAKKSIETFSELLRYRLYDNPDEKTTLSKELDFIKNYISLEKIRHSDKLRLEVSYPEIQSDLSIYPFLFSPLIENAFKFVGGERWIKIDIRFNKNELRLHVKNAVNKELIKSDNNGGIGISNLQRRLDLLYPNQYSLTKSKNENEYESTLTIDLHEA